MSSKRILVGLHADGKAGEGWRRILLQEGLPLEISQEPVSTCGVFSAPLPEWFGSWVSEGGIAVVSGAPDIGEPFSRPVFANVHYFSAPESNRTAYAPGPANLFKGEGYGTCRLHEDRKVKGGNDPDVFPLVIRRDYGKGTIYLTGLKLAEQLMAAGDCLRRFSTFTTVDERVASIDKAQIADVLVWMLRRAFEIWGVPYIGPVRFPGGAQSVFILRVDVDGLFGSSARRLGEIASEHGIRASFFFNGQLCDQIPGELGDWTMDHEVNQHAYFHNVFDSVEMNYQNLQRGETWVRENLGQEPEGFVAPRGLWNEALEIALVEADYSFSSDFALDFDSLPFRTEKGILQIPVHPYSPERAFVYAEETGALNPTAEETSAYYRKVLADHIERGLPCHFYGHPEVLGETASEVLPELFQDAADLGIPSMTLGEFSAWWMKREQTKYRAEYDPEQGRLEVEVEDGSTPLQVSWPEDISVVTREDVAIVQNGAGYLIGVK